VAQNLEQVVSMKRWLPLLLCALAGFSAGLSSMFWPESSASHPAPPASPAPAAAGAVPPPTDLKLAAAIHALASFDQAPSLRTFAEFGAQFRELDSRQLGQLLDYAELHEAPTDDDRIAFLMQWWLKEDPAAAIAWLQPRLNRLAKDGPGGFLTGMGAAYKMVKAWAKVRPQEALDFARAHPRAGIARVLITEAFAAWPEKGPAERFALLRDFPEGEARASAYQSIFKAWAGRDNAAALAAAAALAPGDDRTQALGSVLKALAAKEPAGALEQSRRLGLSDLAVVSEIVASGAAKDSAVALDWLASLDPLQARQYGPRIAAIWAQQDPAAALSWALEHDALYSYDAAEKSTVRHDGLSRSFTTSVGGNSSNALQAAMSKQKQATLDWIATLPAAQRARMSESAISYVDIDTALRLFGQIAPERQALSTHSIVYQLQGDLGRAQTWAESLPAGKVRESAWTALGVHSSNLPDTPPGPDRDALLSGYVFRHNSDSVENSMAAALQISNAAKRRETFDRAMEYFTDYGVPDRADKARAWLEKADVPADWKRPYQKEASGN
jgi:hypothetical protein